MNARVTRGTLRLLAFQGLVACSGRPATSAMPSPVATSSAAATASTATVSSGATAAPPKSAAPAALSRVALMAHVRHLASDKLNGRAAYSADERAAASYLEKQLRRFGATPPNAVSVGQGAKAPAASGHGGDAGRYQIPFQGSPGQRSANVVAVIAGSDPQLKHEYVVVGAHYDHLGRRGDELFAGAEDNASGTAVVLEIARALLVNKTPLGRSVMVVFFGAEEVGMVGSRAFVARPPVTLKRFHSMVNVDMIARPLADEAALSAAKRLMGIDSRRTVGVLGTKGRPVFRAIVDRACADAGIAALAPEDLPSMLQRIVESQAQGRGDSFRFEDVGIPALFFSSGESDDYHLPSDTVDRLDAAVMELRARAIHQVVIALTHAPADVTADTVRAAPVPTSAGAARE